MRRKPGDVAAVEEDPAAVGREQAGDQVEERGLAGAVRADDGVQASAGEVKAQAVDRGQSAEALGQLLGAQDRLAHGSVRSLVSTAGSASRSVKCASQSRQSPTMPLGAKITTRMATTPTISA